MPADRLLNTLLQLYQDVHDDAKSEQVIGTTTHLLTRLGNPLNLTVLTSQLLTAPAIWRRPGFDLTHALRIVSIYNTAALRVRQDAAAAALEKKHKPPIPPPLPGQDRDSSSGGGGGLKPETWAAAVAKGADDRSHRWQHLLVLTGVLVGFEGGDRRTLSHGLRDTLEQAVVTATNLALRHHPSREFHADRPLVAEAALVVALNYAFPLLSGRRQTQLDCDALLPLLLRVMLRDGCGDGLFLRDVARDAVRSDGGGVAASAVSWSPQSPSFGMLVEMDRRPVMSNMGPLARMAVFATAHARHADPVLGAHDELLRFSRGLVAAWADNRLSGVEPAQLSPETRDVAWPALWSVLRKVLFAVVAVLQAVMSRSLIDRRMLRHGATAPSTTAAADPAAFLAAQSLRILRDLSFISSADGNANFEAYAFTHLVSLDMLCRSGAACEALLAELSPPPPVSSSSHLHRALDLFYLNAAEHMPLSLTTPAVETLLVRPATTCLDSLDASATAPMTTQLFESAHSVILAVFSCPRHGALTARLAPAYAARLLASFAARSPSPSPSPSPRMSPRQLRVAFRTLVQMVSPPFPAAAHDPLLGETLPELLLAHLPRASPVPFRHSDDADTDTSPQSVLVLALIDALPFLPVPLVDEWLTRTARAVRALGGPPALGAHARQRFWELLAHGEMDVERGAVAVAWWSSRGGRELLFSDEDAVVMSGAIVTEESKL